jgi:Tfp pilus assembly protein PilO
MSAETKVKTDSAAKVRVAQYKSRVSDFVGSRRGKMFGIAEVVGLAGSCLILTLVLLSYLYFLVPARSRVASLINDNKQLQTNLETLRGVNRNEQSTTTTVQQITTSLDKFETDFLPRQDEGRMQLYDELNQLIIKNGVRNTSGPTYTALEPEGTKTAGGKNMATKWQSFYPGVSVMVTVEGQYENVRRFIRDVERSKQFVVINEVELQRARDNNAPVSAEAPVSSESDDDSAAATAAGSGTRGSLVSLQLSMATYFKREVAASAPAGQ